MIRKLDRRHLEYFLAVVDNGGFTNASRALYVAQPSLSQTVRALENELGAALFQRLGHAVRLTPAGEALVPPARRIVRDFEAAKNAVENVADLSAGNFDIAAIASLAADPLASLLAHFHEAHPGIVIRISDPKTDSALDLIQAGECELALIMNQSEPVDFRTIDFPPDELFLALPPESEVGEAGVVSWRELEGVELIAVPTTKSSLKTYLTRLEIQPRIGMETMHRDSIVPLILGGVGAALLGPLSAKLAEECGASLCRIDPPLYRRVCLVCADKMVSPAARAFVDLVQSMHESNFASPSAT